MPTAGAEVQKALVKLVSLTLGVDERKVELYSQKERVQFLRARNKTSNFVNNLWKAFIVEHKADYWAPPRGGTSGIDGSRAKVQLIGEGAQSAFEPFEHKKLAWKELDRLRASRGRRSGLIVIPTGGGKTATMVTWLVKEMTRRPRLRVLWIADQQELVDQAVREFERTARTAPAGFNRLLRAAHSTAGPLSAALGDPETDVVCTTRQSLIGRDLDRKKKATIEAFLSRPTVVVIDEAHHAVSPTYQELIDFLWVVGRGLILVGMTATPWPAGAGQTARLWATFPRELASVTTEELVANGDLARPVVHTVATDERVELNAEDLRKLAGREVPSAIARRFDRQSLNEHVVDHWLDRRAQWGKTLVFACDTTHADSLERAFRGRGVMVDAIHSAADVDRSRLLDDFRRATEPRVLVSVNMLLEGVDIPSARTAFLCRPTASRIVMRQMVGRVLRGVRAGGDVDAHIVDFVDQWTKQAVLSPLDIPNIPVNPTAHGEGKAEHALPRILADDGLTEIPPDLLRSIEKAMAERVRVSGLTATLTSSRLVGFFDLDSRRIPVFAYAFEAWKEVATWALDERDKRGTNAMSCFDEIPPPVPVDSEVAAFVEYCQSNRLSPPFTPLNASVDIGAAAQGLIDAEALTEHQRIERLRQVYESSLALSFYPSLQAFIEAIDQEKLALLKVIPAGARPEAAPQPTVPPAQKLRRDAHRELAPLVSRTLNRGVGLLAAEPDYQEWLGLDDFLPGVSWTSKDVKTAWAYWSWRTATKARGKPVIRINLALQAPKSQISDELLMYLIWHELCHHLTPGQGHDAEFRRLESLWPNHPYLDHELDTLHETYALPTARKR